ncbi:MAG: glycosyltransferase, partial [Chloroflexota bacterium]
GQPLILWNQRWEYDKNPDLFFETLFKLAEEGLDFEAAICGEAFGKRPLIFEQAAAQLKNRIIHMGFAEQDQYERLLWQADIVVSTALHEFFGISIVEAIGCHTKPILPNRLSYPEILGTHEEKSSFFYHTDEELYQRLKEAIQEVSTSEPRRNEESISVERYQWDKIAPKYDSLFTSLQN